MAVNTRFTTLFFGKNWGLYFTRGLILLLFGIIIAIKPEETIQLILAMTGVIFIISGVSTLLAAFRMPKEFFGRSVTMFSGVLILAVGAILFAHPKVAEMTIILLISTFMLVSGLFELSTAVSMHAPAKYRTLPAVTGLISIIFAVVMFFEPKVIGWILSFYCISSGILLISTAMVLRRISKSAPVTIEL